MTILDKCHVKDSGKRFAKPYGPVVLGYSVQEIGYPQQPPFSTEYRLSVTVGVDFICNKAQYEDALRNAEQVFLNKIYEDVLQELSEIKRLLYADENSEAISGITAIQQRLTGRI
jgi:hypothetical protein